MAENQDQSEKRVRPRMQIELGPKQFEVLEELVAISGNTRSQTARDAIGFLGYCLRQMQKGEKIYCGTLGGEMTELILPTYSLPPRDSTEEGQQG
jgi:hypothetical protein|tara:strand:- start:81 stop:365 length:285 start_codon:yes stop_codon:yes gene_type:complete